MNRDNSTGKDKEFYEIGKKMFDKIQSTKSQSKWAAACAASDAARAAERAAGAAQEVKFCEMFGDEK